MSQTKCPLCGSEKSTLLITGFDRLCPRENNFNYNKCNECDLVFQSPMPTPDEIPSLYVEDYKPYKTVVLHKIDRRQKKAVNSFLTKYLFGTQTPRKRGICKSIARFMSLFAMKDSLIPHKQCRLLDVGCGNGAWLYKHYKLGWKVDGVEMNAQASEKIRNLGILVYTGTLFEVPLEKKYDVISFRHVIEHVPNPVETLKRANELLVPGGKLIMLLPNLKSFGFKFFGNCWYPLDPPRHLLQFTPETITKLGQTVGLEVEELKTQAQPRMICFSNHYRKIFGANFENKQNLKLRETLITKLKDRENKLKIRRKLLRKTLYLPTLLLALLGHGETMRVVFKKPE